MEYHQHDSTEYYDLGLGANSKEPLLMIITTAGLDLTVPCYTQEYRMCSRILNPDIPVSNDRYFVDIFEIDTDDDIADENNWIKANPIRMSYPEGIQKLRDEYKVACDVPEKMIAFRTKCLNQWVQARENGYMDMAKWNACIVSESPFDTSGCPVYVGFDMSAKLDLTSVSFIVPMQINGVVKYILYSHSFIPNRDRLMEHVRVDHQPYDYWEQAGYITVTDTEVVDQAVVMNYVISECKKHNWEIQMLCFDPANSVKIMLDMSNEGYDVVEVYQSHKSLNECTNGFREQVYEGNVIAIKNPVLTYSMSNAIVKTTQGLIKIDKDATRRRIDPVDATLCAFKLALYHEFPTSGYYDSEEWLKSDW